MLNNKGFDLWADNYDESVAIYDNDESYPFAGYKKMLNEIYNRILDSSCKNVLDIGFGTGTLISRLYEHGLEIYGQDFSKRMLEIAQEKMPKSKLFEGDISKGLVDPLLENKYDVIIATYSLHHLTDSEKAILLKSLLDLLDEGGVIYIADVAFESRDEHNKCMKEVGDEWDEDEIYFVIDEFSSYFPEIKFEKFSKCAGLITLKK
ncbi:methyltransferase domain-containing protein [Peptoniphilus sp. GNH]|nr:methyltransferase domain-containing protein [Peptoniphilus sp. GNH]